jgi:hypothetical protein
MTAERHPANAVRGPAFKPESPHDTTLAQIFASPPGDLRFNFPIDFANRNRRDDSKVRQNPNPPDLPPVKFRP